MKKILTFILTGVLALGQILPVGYEAMAEDATFIQTDWTGGASATTAVDPTNRTGWNKYTSKDANADASLTGMITMSTASNSIVESTDTHFNAGTKTNLDVTGTGTAGALKLKALTNDNLRSTLGKWASPEPVPPPPSYGASACYPGSGNYIYILRGNHSRHFVRYDVVNKKFASMAPTPRTIYHGADLVYPGAGDYIYALRGSGSKDFWRYSITTNTWSSLANTLAGVWFGGSITAYDTDTLYATQGWGQTTFWKYTISTNTWLARGAAPASIGYGAQLCYPGTGNFIYLTRGYDTLTLYKYDVTLNGWTTAADAPYTVGYSGELVSGGDGYLYATFQSSYQPYFARYSTSGNTWTSISSRLPYLPNYGTCLARHSVQNKLYALAGYGVNTIEMPAFDLTTQKWDRFSGPGGYTYGTGYAFIKAGNYIYSVANCQNSNTAAWKKFYRFNLTTEEWETMADLPTYTYYPRSSELVWTGAGSTYEDYIYWMNGYGTDTGKLYRYKISTNAWEYLSVCPYTADNYYSTLYYPGTGDIVWVIPGHNATSMYKYSLSANTWTATSATPSAFYLPYGGITYPNPSTADFIYVHRGRDVGDFWRYSVSANTWTSMASNTSWYPSWNQGSEMNLIYPGSGDYIYMNRGNGGYCSRYSISLNTWSDITFPFSDGYYHAWHYPGSGDFIYIAGGGGYSNFYKYSISGNTYTQLKRRPVSTSEGWLCMPNAAGDAIYFFANSSYPLFLKYTISTNTWTSPCYDIGSQTYGFYYGSDTLRVGNYIYAALGGASRSFYKYDIANEAWQLLKPTPGPVGSGGYLAYPGTGDFIYATAGGETKDFWKYSITNDEWTALADVSGTVLVGACMAAPGDGFIYLLRGGTYSNMYKYSIAGNSWSNLNNSPVYSYHGTEMIYPGSGNFFYVMMTYNNKDYFYKYNYNTDAWTTLVAFPRQNQGFPSFTYTGGDYIYCLDSGQTNYLYRYSISGNTWVTLRDAPQLMYQEGQLEWGGPSYPDLLFAWGGFSGASNGFDSGFNGFKYSIADNKWDCPSTHAANSGYYNYETGGLLTPVFYNGDKYLYNYKQDYSSGWKSLFYRLNLETQVWESRAVPPGVLEPLYGGDIYYPGSGDFIYATAGNATSAFYRYSISTNAWTSLTSTPDTVYYGARLTAGQDGYLYLTRGYGTTTFWRYNISANTWTTRAVVPGAISYGSDLIYASKNNALYCLQGGSDNAETNGFYKFNLSTQVWSTVASIPSAVKMGGSLAYPGIGDYIYATSNGRAFLRYSITNDTWEELDPLPSEYHYGGDMAYGGDGYLYMSEGYRFNQVFLRRYNILASGEYTSQILEPGVNTGFGAASWTDTGDNTTTAVKVLARSSNSSSMTGAPGFKEYLTSGADISSIASITDKDKYLQYKVELKTLDLAALPEFRDITLNYLYYPREQTLTSSVYNTNEATNRLTKLYWTETLLSGTDARLQLRTSADAATWTSWLGPTGTTSVGYNFSTAGDYAKSSLIKLDSGYARLYKELEDFGYKQAVTIDNTGGGAQTNAVGTLTLSSTNAAFWSHVGSAGADIRFYDPATSQKIAYNLSSFDYTNKTATINIKIPSLAAGEVKTIYMLYGSANAASESDGTIWAYVYYENFTAPTLSNYSYANTTFTSGTAKVTGLGNWGNAYLVHNTAYARNALGTTLEAKVKVQNSGSNATMIGWGTSGYYPNMTYAIYFESNGTIYIYEDGNSRGVASGTQIPGNWYDVKIVMNATQGATYYLRPTGTETWTTLYTSNYSTANNLKFCVDNHAYGVNSFDVDDYKIYYGPTATSGISSYIPVPEEAATSPTLGASWPYREVVTLTNSGAALTDYQVKVVLDSSHTEFWSRILSNGNDVRFIDSDNTTALNYYLDAFDYTNKTATIYVKVPSLAVGSRTIYLYYGNATASAASSGTNTFDLFDDFSGTAVDTAKWTVVGSLWTVSGGVLSHPNTLEASGAFSSIYSTIFNSSDYIIHTKMKPLAVGASYGKGIIARVTDVNNIYIFPLEAWYTGRIEIGKRVGGTWTNLVTQSTSVNAGTWYNLTATLYGTTLKVSDGTNTYSVTDSSLSSGKVGLTVDNNETPVGAEFDYIFVRKYAATEPTVAYVASETANTYSITGSYYTSNPTIQPIIGAFYVSDLAEFQETSTKPAGTNIKYQVSNNGYKWYWFNATSWVLATGGTSEANTAAEINTNLAAFMTQVASSGEFVWRAYMTSTGTDTALLDQVNINLASSSSYYLNAAGATAINPLHTDAINDKYYQYKVTLYSMGENVPIIDDVKLDFVKASITLTSPVGSEIWPIGSIKAITWGSTGLIDAYGVFDQTVKIEYSTDAGSTWTTEAASAPNTGTYNWTVDNAHTAQARVKVTANGWPQINSSSAANFRMVGALTLTAPNGAERWLVGTQQNVTWTSSGADQIPNVKIEYSTNSGTSYSPVIESEGTANDGIIANDNSFTWTIPDAITPADTCIVRISDAVDADTKDVSDAVFRIIGALNTTYPTLNASLTAAQTYNVTWTTTGTIPEVLLSYSINGGTTWRNMAGVVGQVTTVTNTNTYSWTVPNYLTETALIKVVDKNDSTVSGTTPNFYIHGFQITSPNGAEEWQLNYSHDITWSSGGTITVPIDIWLSTDSGTTYPYWLKRFSTIPGALTWAWLIDGVDKTGASYPNSDTCRIKIVDGTGRMDISDANFKILVAPGISVMSPDSQSSWTPGTSHDITWVTVGNVSADLAIEYSVNNGAWTAVTPAPTSAQITAKSYPWTVVDQVSNNVKLRVKETTAPVGRDTQTLVEGISAQFNVILPTITITAPVSGTTWVVGDTARGITWTSQGTLVDNLTLQYSIDNGTTWNAIATFTQAQYNGSYTWSNIPTAAAGSSVLIRIFDSHSPTPVSDNSDAITILSHVKLTITNPATAEMVIQGDTYNIAWIWDGQATNNNLTIRLSTDGGTTWPTVAPYMIDTAVANTPTTYPWVVPSTIETQQAKLRIYDPTDPLTDHTTGNFSISLPVITVTAPAANANWYANGTYDIVWSTIGSVGTSLKIEYSLDAGAWQLVTAATTAGEAAAKKKAWTLPNNAGSTCRIRITDNNRVAITTTSSSFNIIAPTVSITSPIGTESGADAWVVGTQQNISWTSTGGAQFAVDSLRIQYTTDGTTFTNIALITDPAVLQADSGSYTWTVVDAVSTNVRIKIFDPTRTATTATSNAFEIAAPSIVVTSPNLGTESWVIGTPHAVTWYSIGAIVAPLKLYYTANGTTYNLVSAFDGVNDGTYTWTVPDDYAPGTAKVKIEDSHATPRSDTSNFSFTIGLPTIAVDTPVTYWSAGDTKAITWVTTGTLVGPLKVEWSLDNFATTNVLSSTVATSATSYDWAVPAGAVSTTVRTRVTDLGRTQSWGKTNAFTVLPTPVITITAPVITNVGVDSWRIGKAYAITWTDNGGAISNDLKLQYSVNNGSTWTDIATGVTNSGTYNWTVALGASASTTAKIRIYDNTPWKTGANLTSDSAAFEIAIPRINITGPVSTDYWAIGDSGPIRWTSDGFINDDLTIQYSTDGGTSWYAISSGQANDGVYDWVVPDVVSSNAKVRIIDSSSNYGGQQVTGTSAAFNIIGIPTITVGAPNGSEIYVLGDTVPVTWTYKGLSISNNLLIEVSNDNFVSSKQVVASGIPNSGSYTWNLTGGTLTGTTMKLRVTDSARTAITDMSDGYFRIRGGFTLTAPNGGEFWGAKSPQTITWTTRGTIPRVKLEYSTDDGTTWNLIIASLANANSYAWTLPDIQSANVKVRVSDADDATVFDIGDAKFDIVYFTAKFNILDYDTLQHLSDFSVNEPGTGWSQTGQNSPITRTLLYPYGTYTTFFTKSNYIDNSVTWSTPTSGTSTYTITAYLENSASAQVSWESILTYSYSPADDALTAVGSLQRKGKLVGTTELERADMSSAVLTIYEPDGTTIRKTLTATTPNVSGTYGFTYANTSFAAGKVYPATLSIDYRGRPYISSANIDVGAEKLQYEFFTQTATKLAESVTTIEAAVAGGTSQTRADIEASRKKLVGDLEDTREEIAGDIAASQTTITGVLTATEATLKTRVDETKTQVVTAMKTDILNTESTIKTGDTLTIRYRTYSTLSPTIDVYSPGNVLKLSGGKMKEISTTGIYEYVLKFESSWGKGDFTIVCSESTKGTLDALILTVISTDLEQIAGQVAGIMGTTSSISNLKSVAEAMSSQFSVLETALGKMSKDLVSQVKEAAGSVSAFESVFSQLNSLATQIKEMTGESSVNLSKLYDVSKDKKDDMIYLKNKTQELKAAMEINMKMIDNVANKPVTQTWYEYK